MVLGHSAPLLVSCRWLCWCWRWRWCWCWCCHVFGGGHDDAVAVRPCPCTCFCAASASATPRQAAEDAARETWGIRCLQPASRTHAAHPRPRAHTYAHTHAHARPGRQNRRALSSLAISHMAPCSPLARFPAAPSQQHRAAGGGRPAASIERVTQACMHSRHPATRYHYQQCALPKASCPAPAQHRDTPTPSLRPRLWIPDANHPCT